MSLKEALAVTIFCFTSLWSSPSQQIIVPKYLKLRTNVSLSSVTVISGSVVIFILLRNNHHLCLFSVQCNVVLFTLQVNCIHKCLEIASRLSYKHGVICIPEVVDDYATDGDARYIFDSCKYPFAVQGEKIG